MFHVHIHHHLEGTHIMPALLAIVTVGVVLGYVGMGEDNRKKFWKSGLSGLWSKNKTS